MKKSDQDHFSETHHALLFAWIAREIIHRLGQDNGEQIIIRAVRRYGEQRGRRMALRAKADNQDLSMANFLVYGEWKPTKQEEVQHQRIEESSDIRVLVHQCPWNNAWTENDLIQYGRLYCQEIDRALVRGFNPELNIEVDKTLTNENEPCEFLFHNANLFSPNTVDAKNSVMPWDYHCGHLVKTFSEILEEEFGQEGQVIIQAALAEFGSLYGEEAVQTIVELQDIDYNLLPE